LAKWIQTNFKKNTDQIFTNFLLDISLTHTVFIYSLTEISRVLYLISTAINRNKTHSEITKVLLNLVLTTKKYNPRKNIIDLYKKKNCC